ncbi:DeoR/GlpR family DNA-binding transcription regulator [Rhizobium sp. YJ-22]|uniref:DeoR/GlpR family DNA-binding transcription regulator n=1 Tax=Rhizobium sp. YJ-22 TaxID=3037556 RepID=UPI002412CF56|nr:DeoR/GlpR family DNA-binding transcription regulator [Rhizobium sp. YJ-22]MDG3577918.1 DeoR/GlpR family DNA-binding transcription regulator [Rhizobium sp. YJ-22]
MADRKSQRVAALADALGEHRVLHVRRAAELLKVSEMTIRRDVANNPASFQFLGGHIMLAGEREGEAPYELGLAANQHASAKRAACRHALKHVARGDTIYLDCGTTLVHLVEMLPENADVSVVCCAMNVAERLARRPDIRMIMLGGLYHPSTASFSGNPGLETLDQLGINIALLSAAGIDFTRGATCAHFHEVPIKQKVIGLAQRCHLVADRSKIGVQKPAFFAPMSAFQSLITEEGEQRVK